MSKVVDTVVDTGGDIFGLGRNIFDKTVGALWDSLSPEVPEEDLATLGQGLQKGIDQPRRITFGRDLVGGVIAHQAEVEKGDKKWMQLIVLINGAPIDALEEIYIADKKLSEYPTESWDYELSDGRQTIANTKAMAKMAGWTSEHIGFGQSYIFIEIENNREVFEDGISDMGFLIRGARVWDPRDTSQDPDDESTWIWSQNAVLCALHYVRFYGAYEVPFSRLPLQWWIAAINVCDEEAEFTDAEGVVTTEPRYTTNGSFTFSTKPIEVLNQLEACFAGKIFRQMGQWYVRVGAWYGNPTHTINQDDVHGNIKIKWHADLRDRANVVRATFTDPDQNYDRTDAPPVVSAGYQAIDNQILEKSISLPFVRSSTTAQRLATIHLEQTRLGEIELPLKHKGLAAAVGRTVYLNLPGESINNKVYRVTERRFRLDGGVTLMCVEDAPDLWADNLVPGAQNLTPNSDYLVGKPQPVFDVRVTIDGDGNGIIKWYHPAPLAVHEYDVEFINTAANEAVFKTSVTYTQVVIPNLQLGEYTARISAKNIFGQRSLLVAVQFSVLTPTLPTVHVTADYNQITLTAEITAAGIGTAFEWEFLGSAAQPQSGERVLAQIYNRIGLKSETEYQFRVRSVNHLGSSDWVNITAATTTVDLTEYINELPLTKLSKDAQTLIEDINTQVDRLRPDAENNLPSLIAKNINAITGLNRKVEVLDPENEAGLPALVKLNNLAIEKERVAIRNIELSVLSTAASYTNWRQEYERRVATGERLIDAAVYIDKDTGTIVNRAHAYTDEAFRSASLMVDGLNSKITLNAQELASSLTRISKAEAQLVVQAAQINQKATFEQVDSQIAGALAALQPAYNWQFNSGDEGFNPQSHHATGYIVATSKISSPAINYNADENPMFRLRVRKHAGAQWIGKIYFNGGNSPINVPEPTTNEWENLNVDATGTQDYTGTINSLEFDLGACDIDYIQVGKRGANDLALADITARTTELEQDINAATGIMGQYATTNWVTALGYQKQSNVQTLIDSFNTRYGITATLQELDSNGTIEAAKSAQQWINAADGTITDLITQFVNTPDGINDSIAHAEQLIQANADDIENEATARQQLSVRMGEAESDLVSLDEAIVNEQQARASQGSQLRVEFQAQDIAMLAMANEYTRATTGYCVDANGEIVDQNDAAQCELDGHTWVNLPSVQKAVELSAAYVNEQGYQTQSNVSQLIDTFNSTYSITATLQEFNQNDTLKKANNAQQFINAAEGYIKEQITVFNAAEGSVNAKFANVEQTLDAINGTISNNIVQVQGLELDLENKNLNDVINSVNQLLKNNELTKEGAKLAVAQTELKAKTDEIESVASQALELAAIFEQASGQITVLNQIVANEKQVAVLRDERYLATFDTVTARFSDVTTAIATIDEANTVRDQEFESFVADTISSFDEVAETFASQNQAFTTLSQTLTSKIENDTDQAKNEAIATAQEYTRTAVGYCVDAEGNITSENDAVVCVDQGGSWVQGPLAEYISNLQISDGESTASIKELKQVFKKVNGELVARGGWVLDNNGRAVSVAGYNDGETGNLDLVADVIRHGVMVGETFVPTIYVDNTDPANPVQTVRGRMVLGDGYAVESEEDIRAQDGADGVSVAPVYLYKRVNNLPDKPHDPIVYDFVSKQLASQTLNGWSTTIPEGTEYLYVIMASASSTGRYDTIQPSEWSNPVIFSVNGKEGTDGLNSATINIYKRGTSTPNRPTGSATYNFESTSLDGLTGGWSLTVPSGNDPIYVRTVFTASPLETSTIEANQWSEANVLAKNGEKGEQGESAYTNLIRSQDHWVVGTSGAQGIFARYGMDSQNRIISATGPEGTVEPIWEGSGTSATQAGGFAVPVYMDINKSYRYSVWIKEDANNDHIIFWGPRRTVKSVLDNTDSSNPYFVSGANLPTPNKWYLAVAVLHASNYTGGISGLSGIYDPDTGERVYTREYEYKGGTQHTDQGMRLFRYAAETDNTKAYFCRPRIEEINGEEMSLGALLGRIPKDGTSAINFYTSAGEFSREGIDYVKQSEAGWNAGISSKETFVHATASGRISSTARIMFGLSYASSLGFYKDLKYGIYSWDGDLGVFEDGIFKGWFGTATGANRLSVVWDGVSVRYYKDATLIYTSTTKPTAPVLFDLCAYDVGDTFAEPIFAPTGRGGENGQNGENGKDGQNGQDGTRGSVQIEVATSTGVWYDSTANNALPSAPVIHDRVTIYKASDPAVQTTKRYTGSSWQSYVLHVHGSALIEDTLDAKVIRAGTTMTSPKIEGGEISGVTLNLSSGSSGARTEMTESLTKVYNSSGNLIVRLGVW